MTGADASSALAAASSGLLILASVHPVSMTLDTGETGEGTVTIIAADGAPIGTSAKITLSVQSASSSAFNFLSTDVTVFEDQPDLDCYMLLPNHVHRGTRWSQKQCNLWQGLLHAGSGNG